MNKDLRFVVIGRVVPDDKDVDVNGGEDLLQAPHLHVLDATNLVLKALQKVLQRPGQKLSQIFGLGTFDINQ